MTETITLEWAPLSDDELRAIAKRWNEPGGDKRADASYEMTQRIRATALSALWLRAERTRLLASPAASTEDQPIIVVLAEKRLAELLQVLTGWRRTNFHLSQVVLVDDVFQAARATFQRSDWSWEGLTEGGRAELVSAVQLAFERGVRATIEVMRHAVRGEPVPEPYREGLPR